MLGMQRATYGAKDSEHLNMPLSPDHHPFTTVKNLHTMSFGLYRGFIMQA